MRAAFLRALREALGPAAGGAIGAGAAGFAGDDGFDPGRAFGGAILGASAGYGLSRVARNVLANVGNMRHIGQETMGRPGRGYDPRADEFLRDLEEYARRPIERSRDPISPGLYAYYSQADAAGARGPDARPAPITRDSPVFKTQQSIERLRSDEPAPSISEMIANPSEETVTRQLPYSILPTRDAPDRGFDTKLFAGAGDPEQFSRLLSPRGGLKLAELIRQEMRNGLESPYDITQAVLNKIPKELRHKINMASLSAAIGRERKAAGATKVGSLTFGGRDIRSGYNWTDLINEALTPTSEGRMPSRQQITAALASEGGDVGYWAVLGNLKRAVGRIRRAKSHGPAALERLAKAWNIGDVRDPETGAVIKATDRLLQFATEPWMRQATYAQLADRAIAAGATTFDEILQSMYRALNADKRQYTLVHVRRAAKKAAADAGIMTPESPRDYNMKAMIRELLSQGYRTPQAIEAEMLRRLAGRQVNRSSLRASIFTTLRGARAGDAAKALAPWLIATGGYGAAVSTVADRDRRRRAILGEMNRNA